jgi:hypothetical protein
MNGVRRPVFVILHAILFSARRSPVAHRQKERVMDDEEHDTGEPLTARGSLGEVIREAARATGFGTASSIQSSARRPVSSA